MSYFEYRVVPAPKSVPRVKGVKSPEGRFAVSMAEALNAEGRDGWEFQSSETIDTEVKGGLFSKTKIERLSVLVFRRWVETEIYEDHPPRAAEQDAADPALREPEAALDDTAQFRPTLSARRDDAPQGSAPTLAPPRRD